MLGFLRWQDLPEQEMSAEIRKKTEKLERYGTKQQAPYKKYLQTAAVSFFIDVLKVFGQPLSVPVGDGRGVASSLHIQLKGRQNGEAMQMAGQGRKVVISVK